MGPLWGSHTVPHLHGTRPATDPPPPTGSSFSFLGSWARPCVQLVMFWLLRDTFVPPGRREQEPGNQGTEGNRLQSILGGPGEACSSSMFQMSPTSHPPLLPVCPPASVQAAWGPPPAPCSPLQKPRAPAPALLLRSLLCLLVQGAGSIWLLSRPRPGASEPSPCLQAGQAGFECPSHSRTLRGIGLAGHCA